jgi:hypothetical protein
MSWQSLIGIYRAAALERQAEDARPPTACPNDGQPLLTGPDGRLFCDFDGWRP